MSKTLEWLQAKEWKAGNGQCPECWGVHEGWLGHPLHLDASRIGHKKDCPLAAGIAELGGSPLYIGEFKSDAVYKITTKGGFLATELVSGGPQTVKGGIT